MNPKYKRILSSDFNYSQIGEATIKQFSYYLDKKKNYKNILKGKKYNKLITEDYLNKEDNDVYDDLYEKGEYDEDIFDKNYKNKYNQIIEEQKQKYLNLNKSCSFIIGKNKKKIIENTKYSKKSLLEKFDNERFKYHLIHHHHDYYLDQALLKANTGQVASTSYNPKMEYIYKKILYCPEFKKMSGRYDKENLKEKIEHQIEKNIKHKKEQESKLYKKKIHKIRLSIQIQKNRKKIYKKNNDNDNLILPKRHKSLLPRNSSSRLLSVKLYDIDEELPNESRNFNKKLFKRTNTMQQPHLNTFGFNNNKSKKNSFAIIKNIEEDENEEDNNDSEEKNQNNISNNLDDNTISSINYNKTNYSGKKKNYSNYYNNNNDTDIIYPNNISKNDSNILINNNYSYRKDKEEKNDKINSFRNGDNNNSKLNITYSLDNNSSKKKLNKKNKSITSNITNKQNLFPSLNNNNKVVNFEKMISREYLRKLNEQKYNIYSSLSPNYEAIRPKVIMKVKYEKKQFRKNKAKEYKSVFNEFVFDINKVYNNYNNHFPTKDIYLDKSTGRKINDKSPLPSYMVNQYDRNAINVYNDKSLEMNNYSNGNLKILKSSYNEKKSFNYKLNDQYYNNDNNKVLKSIMRKINKNINKKSHCNEGKSLSCSNIRNSLYKNTKNEGLFRRKIPDYYKVNLDKLEKYPFSNGEKIDGFTLKTIRSNKSAIDLLTENEKKIFLSRLES